MRSDLTPQEVFWTGEFGDEYSDRNADHRVLASKTAMLARVLKPTQRIESVLEYGANVGLNLVALKALLPAAQLYAVEINRKAFESLSRIEGVSAHCGSMLDYSPPSTVDLAFTAGVLIHINPDRLRDAYTRLYNASHRYVMVAEYYNPVPIAVPYRGHADRLFKRDWAGEMMDAFPDLRLVDYGFVYRRDPAFPADDITWFLMEKTSRSHGR